MNKKLDKVQETLIFNADFDGFTLNEIRQELDRWEWEVKEKGGFPSTIFVDYEPYGYDGGFDMAVKYHRRETDKEYEKRLKYEARLRKDAKARKEKAKERRRKEYEKLKKEFKEENSE